MPRPDPSKLPIWNKHPDYKAPQSAQDTPNVLPRPAGALGHAEGYTSDQWHVIEALLKHDGTKFKVRMLCHGAEGMSEHNSGTPCQRYVEVVVWKALYDPCVKYLCPECINKGGFMWGSQLEQDEMRRDSPIYTGYQYVRKYEDDDETLWRRVDKSVNYGDPIHKPIEIHDELKRKTK